MVSDSHLALALKKNKTNLRINRNLAKTFLKGISHFFFHFLSFMEFAVMGRLYRVIHGSSSSFRDSVLKWG